MTSKLTSALFCLCVVFGGTFAHAGPVWPFPGSRTVVATPFPWGSIQGVWETTDLMTGTRFSFDILRDANGNRVLHVTQFAYTGAVLAEGLGYQNIADPNTVNVFMRPAHGGPQFEVVVQSYADAKTGKGFDVMTMGPVREDSRFDVFRPLDLDLRGRY